MGNDVRKSRWRQKSSAPSQRKCHFLGFNLPEILPIYNENDEKEQKSVRTGHLKKVGVTGRPKDTQAEPQDLGGDQWLYKTRFGVVFVFAVFLRSKAVTSGGGFQHDLVR